MSRWSVCVWLRGCLECNQLADTLISRKSNTRCDCAVVQTASMLIWELWTLNSGGCVLTGEVRKSWLYWVGEVLSYCVALFRTFSCFVPCTCCPHSLDYILELCCQLTSCTTTVWCYFFTPEAVAVQDVCVNSSEVTANFTSLYTVL